MSTEVLPKGRLISLEGACGQELKLAAKSLLHHFCRGELEGGISYWDASGIFTELRWQDPNIARPSPRTLVLLYAADLAFRLRWEIRPALEEGQCVVAAPYVHTAIAFGKAAGLPRRWLLQLFRFAPKPYACYRTFSDGVLPGTPESRPSDGYFEFCCAAVRSGSLPWDLVELHNRFRAYLDAVERRRRCTAVTAQFPAASDSDP